MDADELLRFPPNDSVFPGNGARSSQLSSNGKKWQIVQSQLYLRDLLPSFEPRVIRIPK